MKKILLIAAAVIVAVVVSIVCINNNKKEVLPTPEEVVAVVTPESIYGESNLIVSEKYTSDYSWFETEVRLSGNCDTLETFDFVSVTSIFQFTQENNQPMVLLINQDQEVVEKPGAFVLEDLKLNDVEVNLTFEDAFNRLHEVNYPLPSTSVMLLRKPLGPTLENPQYFIGKVLKVDAITGEVKTVE